MRSYDWSRRSTLVQSGIRLMPTADGNGDEDFEFLVNLLASDGVDSDPLPPLQATGSHQVDHGPSIQRGPDGRLDLGQVKTFYEKKNNMKMGTGTGIGAKEDNPGLADPRHHRNHSGLLQWLPGCISRCACSCVMWRGLRMTLTRGNYRERWERRRAGKCTLQTSRTAIDPSYS